MTMTTTRSTPDDSAADSGMRRDPLRIMGDDVPARPDSEEEQRRGGAERFRRVVEASPIGIAFWGADGALFDANDSFCAVTGYAWADIAARAVNWRPMMTGI